MSAKDKKSEVFRNFQKVKCEFIAGSHTLYSNKGFLNTSSHLCLMQMCACWKEHMTIHCVFCALCMVYLGSAVSWNRQDCNRQSMQRVQMLGHKGSFPRSHFLDPGHKKWQKVLRHWR